MPQGLPNRIRDAFTFQAVIAGMTLIVCVMTAAFIGREVVARQWLRAEADAEKVRIAAQAQAEANRLIQQSLTQELIEMKKVEAWDGKLPTVMGSDTLLGLGSLADQ